MKVKLTVDQLKKIKLRTATCEAVKATIKSGYFKQDDNSRFNALKELNQQLASIYKIEPPELCWFPNPIMYMITGGGQFQAPHNKIFLFKPKKLSLVTFLHEFKHALDHATKKKTTESKADKWSLAIYCQVVPKMFQKAVNEGKIFAMQGATK